MKGTDGEKPHEGDTELTQHVQPRKQLGRKRSQTVDEAPTVTRDGADGTKRQLFGSRQLKVLVRKRTREEKGKAI